MLVVVGLVEIADVLAEHGGGRVALGKVAEQALVEHPHHGADDVVGALHLVAAVDALVVLFFRRRERRKVRLVQPQIGQEVAVFKKIDHQVVDDLRVDGADARIGELHAPERLALLRVVAVFAEVGDDVGDAHHAPLERGGNERPDAGGVFAARRHAGVELRKVRKGSGAVFAHLQFSVVGGDAVQRLQREVERENFVQHAHGVQIVRKMQPRMRKIQLVQKALARVPERGMPDVVPQGDRLDELAVEPQRPPQRARRA